MTNEEKRHYIKTRAVGYASMLGGVEVKDIIYGIEDYVIYTVGAWTGKPTAHKGKIYYGDRSYFKYNGTKIYFDDVIRY